MRCMMIGTLFAWGMFILETAFAQVPTGAIAGRALDPSGAAISGARVVVTNKETQASRELVTAAEGDYSAPALPAGLYEVVVETPGFERLRREVLIEAGTTTTVDLLMHVGPSTETVTVSGA